MDSLPENASQELRLNFAHCASFIAEQIFTKATQENFALLFDMECDLFIENNKIDEYLPSDSKARHNFKLIMWQALAPAFEDVLGFKLEEHPPKLNNPKIEN